MTVLGLPRSLPLEFSEIAVFPISAWDLQMLNNWLLAVRLFVAFRLTKARFVLPSYGQLKSAWVGQKLSVIKDVFCFVYIGSES